MFHWSQFKMKDELQYDLCPGCGEHKPVGLLPSIMHSCPLNTVIYYSSAKFSIRHIHNIVSGKDPLQPFKDLLHFPYLKAMSGFETASIIDKKIYRICRESDLRSMKRLRAYIDLEERFNASW